MKTKEESQKANKIKKMEFTIKSFLQFIPGGLVKNGHFVSDLLNVIAKI